MNVPEATPVLIVCYGINEDPGKLQPGGIYLPRSLGMSLGEAGSPDAALLLLFQLLLLAWWNHHKNGHWIQLVNGPMQCIGGCGGQTDTSTSPVTSVAISLPGDVETTTTITTASASPCRAAVSYSAGPAQASHGLGIAGQESGSPSGRGTAAGARNAATTAAAAAAALESSARPGDTTPCSNPLLPSSTPCGEPDLPIFR